MLNQKEKSEKSSSSSYEGAGAGSGSTVASELAFFTAFRRRTGGFFFSGSDAAAGFPTLDALGGVLRRCWPMEAGSEEVDVS